MARKIVITILAGSFYWLLEYLIMKIFVVLNIIYTDNTGKVMYFLIPFLLGALLIIIIRETIYAGLIYSALVIIIRYAVTLIELSVQLPTGRNPLEETLWLFNLLGKYSMLSAMVGGLLAILFNRRKRRTKNYVRSA